MIMTMMIIMMMITMMMMIKIIINHDFYYNPWSFHAYLASTQVPDHDDDEINLDDNHVYYDDDHIHDDDDDIADGYYGPSLPCTRPIGDDEDHDQTDDCHDRHHSGFLNGDVCGIWQTGFSPSS